eukprot:TRINITY_DN27425_c0_g1_i1.p1 TRINITY_DN27425_c0_g1~~TRINITY_DN27425_c0_g1_i1.p1  ORF type:complete len:509 (+),score=46.14 TRINITY_DN27425_c0_g1_i1:102-1628(+)
MAPSELHSEINRNVCQTSSAFPTSKLKLPIPRSSSAPALRRPSSAPSRSSPNVKSNAHLSPSVAPTPRPLSATGIRATISAPSAGAANDAARARNLGRRLYGNISMVSFDGPRVSGGLRRVVSEPTLASGIDPETPRRIRGMVRSVSKVPVAGCAGSPLSRKPRPPSFSGRRSTSASALERPPKSEDKTLASPSPKKKRVSFADDKPATTTIHPARQRASKLLDSLYSLRRAGCQPDINTDNIDIAQAEQAEDVDEVDESIMHVTLRDLMDTEEKLLKAQVPLTDGTLEALDFGGGRHPTTLVSGRALIIMKRKASLLHDVEARIASFEAAYARREDLLKGLVDGSAVAPAELGGIRKFLAAYTHSNCDPADDNKSDFAAFAASFKLPAKHSALQYLKRIASEAGEWWAEACLSKANDGQGHAVLTRILDVALGTGVDRDHPKLFRAMRILRERLAHRVLDEAKQRQERDAAMVATSATPQVGLASRAADAIEQDIANAIKDSYCPKE